MSEYWKSQPKKFCQYCKCWIADNKPSVEFHERGKNHKENVSLKIAEMQKKSIDKAKLEDRQSKEFAAMEKAALKAYEEDCKRLGIEPEPASQPKTEAQPPAPAPAPAPAPPCARPQTQAQPLSKRQEKKLKKMAGTTQQEPRNEGQSWKEGKTDDGHTYYYSTVTGESQWDKPERFRGDASSSDKPQSSAGSAWMEAVSPDGFTYYYNTETGESSWENPADLADKGEESETSGKTVGQVDPSPSPPQLEPAGGGDSSKVAEGEGEYPKQPEIPIRVRKRKDGTQLSEKGDEDEEDEKGDEGDSGTPALPEEEATPAKKPRKNNPYGVWEKIQEEEDPYKNVDLQLPKVEADPASRPTTDLPPEPKPKFKERKITSLGVEGGSSTFRKRKTENGKSRSLRQRGNDDDD